MKKSITTNDLFSIDLTDGYATITVGEHVNKFECSKEDAEQLSHMIEVIASSNGIYGTDIVDFGCIFERCSNHRFTTYLDKSLDLNDSVTIKSTSKAMILLVIGSEDMGLSDVNSLINEIARVNSAETEIIFTAENSEMIAKGHYTICVLD